MIPNAGDSSTRKRYWQIAALVAGLLLIGFCAFVYVVVLRLKPMAPGLSVPMFKSMRVTTGAMLPTLHIGDTVDVNLLVYLSSSPKLGDIVVFPAPPEALQPGQGRVFFIKRCVGLPGDVVEIRGGKFFRNGAAVDEPYVANLDPYGKPLPAKEAKDFDRDFKFVRFENKYWPLTIQGDLVNGEFGRTTERFIIQGLEKMERMKSLPAAKVPSGFCIAMGDNRLNSYDSRGWGLVDLNIVVGRVERVTSRAGE